MKIHKSIKVGEAAKMLGYKRKAFFELLKDKGMMLKSSRRWLPTDRYIHNGCFIVSHSLVNNEGFRGIVPVIRLTEKGFDRIQEEIKKESNNNIYWRIVSALRYSVKKLELTRRDYHNRVIHISTNNGMHGKYVLDFGSPDAFTFLEYDYTEGKIWQNSNT